jgi:membrane-associated protease RseP (regulator of RpoE activity)
MRCRGVVVHGGVQTLLTTRTAFFSLCLLAAGFFGADALAARSDNDMTADKAAQLGEQFGIVVGPVDEEIKRELKMQKPEGVVVFEVIGGTPAELAGIKVRAVIKEIDKVEVRNMIDFGRALKKVLATCNFTVGSYEPADPENQGVAGVLNFHFVPCVKD